MKRYFLFVSAMAMNNSTIYDLRKTYQDEILPVVPIHGFGNISDLDRCELSNSILPNLLEMQNAWEQLINIPETIFTARDNAQVSLRMRMLIDTYFSYLELFCYDEENEEEYDAYEEYDEDQYDALGSQ